MDYQHIEVDHWSVPSSSDPKVKYTVINRGNGTWGCDCPAGHFFRNGKECRHVRAVKELIASGVQYMGKW